MVAEKTDLDVVKKYSFSCSLINSHNATWRENTFLLPSKDPKLMDFLMLKMIDGFLSMDSTSCFLFQWKLLEAVRETIKDLLWLLYLSGNLQ